MPNSSLSHLYQLDKERLEATQVPIVTVSASFKEDIKGWYGLAEDESLPDVVFSRAHYSMAMALAQTTWGKELDPQKAWVVDPTNYVTAKDWQKVKFTEFVGKTIARHPLLKIAKDFVDTFGRNKLPILASIEEPLKFLTQGMNRPVLSMHIATGNLLAAQGKKVVQVVTDPHVREEYVLNAGKDTMTYCVFDQRTQFEFLEKAALLKKQVKPEQVIVTGPPVDPRILAARQQKTAWRRGPLNLCITTGGLGTNKTEIRALLERLLPELRRQEKWLKVLVYAGTQQDIAEMVSNLAAEYRVKIGAFNDRHSAFRLLYHPQITDANELLLEYGFPWADGFITKPSGDMAYDAAAAGCFILTLKEWGVWEENVRQVFEQQNIARQLDLEQPVAQLRFITTATSHRAQPWVEIAMNNAFKLDKLFLNGCKNILSVYQQVT